MKDIIYIITTWLLSLAVVILWAVSWVQGNDIKELRSDIESVKLVSLDDGESLKERIDITQEAVLEINTTLEHFMEVHDENVLIYNELYTDFYQLVDYLSN